MSTSSVQLYDSDFYGWAQTQADVLRAGNFASLDLGNLIEEIEDMGKSRQRELESRLEILLMHLLKWQFQPKRKGKSWEFTIAEQRHRIAKLLRKNPSLNSHSQASLAEAYEDAVRLAGQETNLSQSKFPVQCPWTFDQVMDPDFWPEAA